MNRDINRAHVDAQFERVGRGHGPDLALRKLRLDLAAFERRVAAAVDAQGVHELHAAGGKRKRGEKRKSERQ